MGIQGGLGFVFFFYSFKNLAGA